MKDIINKLEEIFENKTGLLILFSIEEKNNLKLHLKFDINSLPHCFGIQRIQSYSKKNPETIVNEIKKNEISIEIIRENSSIKKDDKKTIYNKIECVKFFLNLEKSEINNIILFKDIKFKNCLVDYVFLYEKYLLCFKSSVRSKINLNSDFDSIYIISVRKIQKDKQLKKFLAENNSIGCMKNIDLVPKEIQKRRSKNKKKNIDLVPKEIQKRRSKKKNIDLVPKEIQKRRSKKKNIDLVPKEIEKKKKKEK